MIQIFAIRSQENQDGKVYSQCKDTKIRASSVEFLFKDSTKFIESIPKSEQYNLYYTIGDCLEDTGGRKLDQQFHIPIDIDGMDLPEGKEVDFDMLETAARVACKALKIDYDTTGVLFSGNGLQLIIGVKKPIDDDNYFDETRAYYRAICDKIDLALMGEAIIGKCDVSVWSKARLMRYPNTTNKKAGKPTRLGKVLQGNIERGSFNLVEASGIPIVAKGGAISKSLLKQYTEPDKDTILDSTDGCKFLGWMKATPNEVTEPLWYAGLSILSLLGREVAHAYSNGHKAYTYEGCEAKINQAVEASGPRTCENINNLWGKCNTCPHFNKDIKSPILIKSKTFITTKASGFHKIVTDGNGNPKPGKPDHKGMVQHFKNEIGSYKYLPGAKFLFIFNGRTYEEMPMERVKQFAYDNFKPNDNASICEEFWKHILLDSAEGENVIDGDWFSNSTKGMTAFRNGVYDVNKKMLVPYHKDAGFTATLDCDFDEHAECPQFESFLDEVTSNDRERRNVLEEFLGYSLLDDDCKYQKALVLLGHGANGKSTLLNVLKALAGKTYSAISIKDMRNEQHRYMLYNKQVNIAEENSRDSFKDVEFIKNFITGGQVTVKRVYLPPFSYTNTTKLIMGCNELPISRDLEYGFFRRFIIVPFDAVFSHEVGNIDIDIHKKLVKELPGIFNLFLKGWKRLESQGDFSKSGVAERTKKTYQEEQGPHALWFRDNVEIDDADEEGSRLSDVYDDYVGYMQDIGMERETQSRITLNRYLSKVLGRRYITYRTRKGREKRTTCVKYIKVSPQQ